MHGVFVTGEPGCTYPRVAYNLPPVVKSLSAAIKRIFLHRVSFGPLVDRLPSGLINRKHMESA